MYNSIWYLCVVCSIYITSSGEASVYLTVPVAGNCGENTILTCHSDEPLQSTGWFGLGRSLMINGVVARPDDSNKYSQTVNGSTFSLKINDTDIDDEGSYRCNVRFEQSTIEHLQIECRAKSITVSVTEDRNIAITIDKVYPQPHINLNILNIETDFQTETQGIQKCVPSSWWWTCVWTSSITLQDGNYNYNATIATITSSSHQGMLRISSPNAIGLTPPTRWYQIEENQLMNKVKCYADCAPDCLYGWSGSHGNNISVSDVLTLGEVDRSAKGEYLCTAWNWFGETEVSIHLTIIYGPENMVFTPTDTSYVKDEGVYIGTIHCTVTCSPNCSVNWFKDNTLISDIGVLELGSIRRGDAGVYQCVATNTDIGGQPTIQKSLEINVRYGPDTVVLSSGSDLSLTVGEPAPDVTCAADCNPHCTFTWTNMSDNSIQSHGQNYSFGLAANSFQGEYRCTVTNNETAKTVYTTLTVTVSAQTAAIVSKSGPPIGAIVGSVVGVVVLICLLVSALVVFQRRRKQSANKETSEMKGQLPVTATMDANTVYEELADREDIRKGGTYDQLHVPDTVNNRAQQHVYQSQSIEGALNSAYEEPYIKEETSSRRLNLDVTDISVHYENTENH